MLTKKIQSIHFFPVKGMQGFEKEKCILKKNKLIKNDRQFALIEIPKQKTSYSIKHPLNLHYENTYVIIRPCQIMKKKARLR